MNKEQEKQLQTNPQNPQILMEIIGEFNEKVIRELKATGFSKEEAHTILRIYAMPLIDALKEQQETILKETRQEIIEMIRETLKDNNISPSDMNIKPVLNREQFITKIKTLTKP